MAHALEPLLMDTLKIRTPLPVLRMPCCVPNMHTNLPRSEDTPLYRTLYQDLKMSTLEGFHYTTWQTLLQYTTIHYTTKFLH